MSKQAASHFSDKRTVAIIAVVAVVLLSYLFLLPSLLAGRYKDTALPAQNAVAEKLTILGEQYKRPAFVKVDVSAADARGDYQATRQALTNAKDSLSQNESKLTGFKKLPGMVVNGGYSAAQTASDDAKEWVSKTKEMLAAGEADLVYFEKSNEIYAKVESSTNALDSLSADASLRQIADATDKSATDLQALLNEQKAVMPTESLKKTHEADVANSEKLINQFKQLAAALRAEDVEAANTISSQIDTSLTESNDIINQGIIDYNRDATVNRLITELQVLDRKLEDDFKKF